MKAQRLLTQSKSDSGFGPKSEIPTTSRPSTPQPPQHCLPTHPQQTAASHTSLQQRGSKPGQEGAG